MKRVSKMVTATILSMSLLTVMAGAAIAPAMEIIKQHFADAPDMTVQLIVSLPALFIVITNLCFLHISRLLRTREIAIIGLVLYTVAGVGCAFIDNIYIILCMRALLGVSVGLIMPLSTGLLAYYFPPEEQAKLMGLSTAMNQMGGVIATLLAGFLAKMEWSYAFYVYIFGLLSLLMILAWLPNEKLDSANKRGKTFEPRQLLKFHPSVIGMFLLTIVFFVFPTNFAIITSKQLGYDITTITFLMVGLDFLAFLVGLVFGQLMGAFRRSIKYFAPLMFVVGYFLYAEASNLLMISAGSALIGLANGIGIPYLLTIASIKGGRNSATTVMPIISAALYLAQFVCPLVVLPLAEVLFGAEDVVGPYKVAILFSFLLLFQVWTTRHFQSLPPEEKH